MSVVHYVHYGHVACMRPGPIKDWAAGHQWSGHPEDVNCAECLKGLQSLEIKTYTISADGQSITCLRCNLTSYHPKDVEHHFCGCCHTFHEDLWPPAKAWWLAQGRPNRG